MEHLMPGAHESVWYVLCFPTLPEWGIENCRLTNNATTAG